MVKEIWLLLTQTMRLKMSINPLKIRIAIESGEDNPYVNVIAVRRR